MHRHDDNQPTSLNATGEPLQGPTAEQRLAGERAQAWDLYSRGGGGQPAYFDGMAWLKMCERQWAREDEAARERSR